MTRKLPFTPQVKQALVFASKEAKERGHEQVCTDHLLIGLLLVGDNCDAFNVLNEMGVTIERVRNKILSQIDESGAPENSSEPSGFLSRVELVARSASGWAAALDCDFAGSLHFLLSIFVEEDGAASRILKSMYIDLYISRRQIIDQIRSGNTIEYRRNPAIRAFCYDLTELACNGEIDPVVCRENEIRRLIQTLCRRNKNNTVLIGEPGVGKTAIVGGLARRIASGDVPKELINTKLIVLDLALILSGTESRGALEHRLTALLNEISRTGCVVLFIDELHTIIGAGAKESSLDVLAILKNQLRSGELSTIGATSLSAYRQHAHVLNKYFQALVVTEPSVEETITILRSLKERYEVHHGVRIRDGALVAAATLADRHIAGRFLPDKAIDLIDEAASRLKIETGKNEVEAANMVRVAERKIESLKVEAEQAEFAGDITRAAELMYILIPQAKHEMDIANEHLIELQKSGAIYSQEVTKDDVSSVCSMLCGDHARLNRESEQDGGGPPATSPESRYPF